MTPTPGARPLLRPATTAAPLLLVVYAVARWWDGRDGEHGPGVAWSVGHVAFLGALLCLGCVLVMSNLAVMRAGRRRTAAVAGVLGVIGVGLFVWVILGDLFPGFGEAYGLPDLVMNLGPLSLLVGLVAPLLVLVRLRRLSRTSPVGSVAAFVLLAVNLDLLLLAAILFGVALRRLPDALSDDDHALGHVTAV